MEHILQKNDVIVYGELFIVRGVCAKFVHRADTSPIHNTYFYNGALCVGTFYHNKIFTNLHIIFWFLYTKMSHIGFYKEYQIEFM